MNQQKIYVALDALNDIKYYNKFKEFKTNNDYAYNFYDSVSFFKELDKTPDDILKQKIQQNIDLADAVVVLLTKTLKSMRKFPKWQLEYAIKSGKPIIAINPNRIRSVDYDVCPTILKSSLSLHIPYNEKALELALMNWPKSHKEHLLKDKDLKKTFKYSESVYQEIFVEEE